jgi:hypothetical protein
MLPKSQLDGTSWECWGEPGSLRVARGLCGCLSHPLVYAHVHYTGSLKAAHVAGLLLAGPKGLCL